MNNKNLNVKFEAIRVSDPRANSCFSEEETESHLKDNQEVEAKNIHNVLNSSAALKQQTKQAIMDGYFPIVLGGDHSQAIGSIAGMKAALPDTKILWMDAHIDANTPMSSPSRNAHGMPLAYLSGQIPKYNHLNCVDLSRDLIYFGIRSYEDGELELI
jgi:arginase